MVSEIVYNKAGVDALVGTKLTYPTGGTDGQVLAKAGTSAVWTTVTGNGTTPSDTFAVYNVKKYGAVGDGSADDTSAINAAWAAAKAGATTAVFGNATNVLYFPAGRYVFNGNINTTGYRVIILGDGPTASILYRGSSGVGDVLTLGAQHCGIQHFGIDGGGVGGSGDLLVMNSAYCFADNFFLTNGPHNGLTIGKTGGAIEVRLTRGFIRYCKDYGIQVISGSGSTDGLWSDLDIGNIGLSAVRISNGSQNLTNVHVWGAGIQSTTDTHGFWLDSDRNSLAGCQAETNNGDGFHINGKGNGITGGSSWGNRGAGVYLTAATNSRVDGVGIYRNGVANTAGAASNAFAGIFNDGSQGVTITGNNVYDDGSSVVSGTYSGAWTPTNPFVGRATATVTQSFAYAEGTGTDFCTIVGNSFRKEQTRSATAVVSVGNDCVWGGNNLGATGSSSTTAAATIFPRPSMDVVKITGAATITNIYTTKGGRRVTFIFLDSAPGKIASNIPGGTGNIYLSSGSDWQPRQNDTLTVVSDGVNWYEAGRSTAVVVSATAPPQPSTNDIWLDIS